MTDVGATPDAEVALLFTPAIGQSHDADCAARLTSGDPTDDGALFVTYRQSAETLRERWRSRVGDEPGEFGVVALGTDDGSSGDRGPRSTDGRNVVTLTRPDRIGRLETAIYLFLDGWRTDDRYTLLCFDSLTALLDHVDRTVAFRFLHSLTDYLRTVGVAAHFHADPEAHDEETVAMFSPLFDTVIGGPTLYGSPVSPDALATLIDSRRRRSVCRYLVDVADPADVSSLADRIAEWESAGAPSEDAKERVRITLHHVHLPMLVEAGLVVRDGDVVRATTSASELARYVRLAGGGDAPPESEPPLMDARDLTTSTAPDGDDEAYWTVYGTARDSVVVTLARALAAVTDVPPTELRPVLHEVVDVDALQRLSGHGDTSVYATFRYGPYEVVIRDGEIKIYDSG